MDLEPPPDIELELVDSTDDEPRPVDRREAAGADPFAFTFEGELWSWRGPAPYHFITVPPEVAGAIQRVAADVTYGWGMIPVSVRIGGSAWETSLWPKNGGYVLPVKDAARNRERIALGDVVEVELAVRR